MPAERSPATFQASDQTRHLIREVGRALDLTHADVLARAVADLARSVGLAVDPEDKSPRHPSHRPYTRRIADPPGPIRTRR